MKNLCLFLIILLPASVHAQTTSSTVFASGGAQLQTPSIQLAVTIGQPLAGDRSSATLLLHQGFQVSSIEAGATATAEFLHLEVYPNPTADKLHITGLKNMHMFKFIWTDQQGREFTVPQTTSEDQVEFDVQSLSMSLYLLRIISAQGNYQIFKILKTK
ncbi:MAG: T9SS type A sorting domain-containing protein [Cyclobacteriaceae bacterium]|nr:T9SS type A sorting domain-containing protein [Cyclobacteriaceae bacterium]